MMSLSTHDGIPVLNDILRRANVVGFDGPKAETTAATGVVAVSATGVATVAAPAAPSFRPSQRELEQLGLRVRAAVLDDLQLHMDRSLQQHFEGKMSAAIDTAMIVLGAELRDGLREHLDAAIRQAVSKEIALLQEPPDEPG